MPKELAKLRCALDKANEDMKKRIIRNKNSIKLKNDNLKRNKKRMQFSLPLAAEISSFISLINDLISVDVCSNSRSCA